jgi:hypothetical protein
MSHMPIRVSAKIRKQAGYGKYKIPDGLWEMKRPQAPVRAMRFFSISTSIVRGGA